MSAADVLSGAARWSTLVGDVRETLRTLPDGCVQCCVTSPPYYGLRDYGCDGQIGLEQTPQEYVDALVGVFREVRRALADDGVVWLNLGDSYAATTKGSSGKGEKQITNAGTLLADRRWRVPEGLKAKDLLGIPWRVAFALQADGWWLRSDVVWAKPNPMPESVTDRPTRAHEYVFLLTKGQRSERTVEFANVAPEVVHLGRHIGAKNPGTSSVSRLCVALATALFDAAQEQCDFGLPPFYSEEWQKRAKHGSRHLVSDLPANHRAAAHAARFLNGHTSAKEFLGEIHGVWRHLTQPDHLLVRGRLAESSLTPRVLVDGDTAVAVDHSGKVCKIDFAHAKVVVTVPTGCKYFYDGGAIREKSAVPVSKFVAATGANTAKLHATDANDFRTHARGGGGQLGSPGTRNARSVWTITPEPYGGAHFATMPPELARRCILAGSRKGDVVLDPFGGAGTTALVAVAHGRRAILCELNPDYVTLQRDRLASVDTDATEPVRAPSADFGPLFGGAL